MSSSEDDQPRSKSANPQQTDKYKDIFGSESELSEEESDKEVKVAARKKSPVRKSAAAAVPTFSDESESDSDDSAADADYGARPDKAGKAYVPSDDEHGQGEVLPRTTSFVNNDQQRKPKKKKEVREKKERKKREPREPRERRESASPEPEEVLDEATIRRRAIDAKIEAIGKSSKRKRPRKAKDDGDDLGADEAVQNVQADMQRAVEMDQDLNQSRQPAVHKTRMLPKVLNTLQNVTYQQSILDTSEFLGALRQFLEPLPDGSLPSLSIQKSLLDQFNRMEFSEEMLRESKLGRIVSFYARCKRCQPEITRQANHLIDKWSRPMLNQQSNRVPHADARDLEDSDDGSDVGGDGGGGGGAGRDGDRDQETSQRQRQRKKQKKDLLRQKVEARHEDEDELLTAGPKSSRIPNIFGHAYTVAPTASRVSRTQDEQFAEDNRLRQQERINNFKKKALKGASR